MPGDTLVNTGDPGTVVQSMAVRVLGIQSKLHERAAAVA